MGFWNQLQLRPLQHQVLAAVFQSGSLELQGSPILEARRFVNLSSEVAADNRIRQLEVSGHHTSILGHVRQA